MIPKQIHQTWRDEDIPEPRKWPESWKLMNPGWDYRLWTDKDLLNLVREHYPELEKLYLSYPLGIQRADLGRYLILDHCGGVYADLDTECLFPLDLIAEETRVILAEEPIENRYHSNPLGLDRLIFNGVMASPKGHSFWEHVITVLARCRNGGANVLETTGPLALTGAVESYSNPEALALHSCHLFSPLTQMGRESTAPCYGHFAGLRICNHYWAGSWLSLKRPSRLSRVKSALRKVRYHLGRGAFLSRQDMESRIDLSCLHRAITPADTNVAVLIPVRDGAPFLDRCLELLRGLNFPKKQLKIVFCEGDSSDGSAEKLRAVAQTLRGTYRDVIFTQYQTGAQLDRTRRWLPKVQRERRSNLARVRNHLIAKGLTNDDHWALWLDVDVCDYAPDILNRLLSERRKVVTPDCVLEWGGPSYDLNAFNDSAELRDHRYYKHVQNGLYMPPADHDRRRHLHDLRFLDQAPLTSVGGTMLLVHASVHRAGVYFPELPYDDVLETEGFGRICRDFGVQPIGLPNVQIRHVRS